MGRMYSISTLGVASSAAQDALEILVPDDAVMVLHELTIGQSSDAGDAEDEQIEVTIKRVTGAPSSGSGGTTPTPVPLEEGSAAAGITAEANNTTQLTGGTATTLRAECFNVRGGYIYMPTPETRPVFSPGTRCVVSLDTAPSDELDVSITAIVEEIGG